MRQPWAVDNGSCRRDICSIIIMHNIPDNFLGIPEKDLNYRSAKIAILPVPYEETVSYGRGTSNGPAAIISASKQVELYDEELEKESQNIGICTLEPLSVKGLESEEMSKVVSTAITKIVNDGKLPVMLGGEHSITPPAVKAVHKVHSDLTVVQLDAHADLRQEYEGNPMSHASAMARVRDFCPAVQVGIRNLSLAEALWVKKDRLPVFFAKDIMVSDNWMPLAVSSIETDKVYVTIDLDAFDSSTMPATGTPEPGGMSWYQIAAFLKKVFESKRVVGLDIVELAPIKGFHACDFLAAKLLYKCIGYYSCNR